MSGVTLTLAGLLAECDTHDIRLSLDGVGGLTIDAPQDALTPNLVARLKANKADLLAAIGPKATVPQVDPSNAAAVWQAALDELSADPCFPPEMVEALRGADVRWRVDEPAPARPASGSQAITSRQPRN
jgi:hypothetical protein